MIVLDTNVLSETLRRAPDARVLAWLAAQPRSAVFTTTVTRGELLYGVRLLPESGRKLALANAGKDIFDVDLAGQVVSFDGDDADAYAEIVATRKMAGKPVSQFDAMIAAIARSRGAGVATLNPRDFADCGVRLVDPWNA